MKIIPGPLNLTVGFMIIMLGADLASCNKETADTSTIITAAKPDTLVNMLDRDTVFERGGSNYGCYICVQFPGDFSACNH